MVIEPEDTEEGRFWSLRMGREDSLKIPWIWTLSKQFVLSWEDCSSIR